MHGSEVIVTFTNWLLRETIDTSFCILLILLVRGIFAHFFGARLCRILWIVLFIRCFVPWSIPVNIYPGSLISEIHSTIDSKLTQTPSFQPVQKVTPAPKVSDTDFPSKTQNIKVHSNIFTSETLRITIAVIWAAGVFTLLGFTILRNRKAAHFAAETPKPVPSWLQEIFLDCRERMKIKIWPVLIVSSNIDSPCLLGAIRPRILLPLDLVSGSNREQLNHILMHELAHIKQGDIWLSWFWTLVCSLQWFNPLAWWAGRYMYIDREMACDELVLRTLESEKRFAYSRSILDLFKKINLPSRRAGLACIVERKTNIERRLGMITKFKIRSNRQIVLGSLVLLIIAALSLASFAGSGQTAKLSSEKAELMGRVADFFMHNFRDVTALKSLQWGEPQTDENGNHSIRYMYEAQIWEKDWKIMNQVFTFNKDGGFVSYKNVEGYPKDKQIMKADTSTEEGMKALVEKFFTQNYRDITARNTIEWGKATTDANGNRSIRYKFEATIWNREKKIFDQIFTFKPNGDFVSVKNADATTNSSNGNIKISTPEETILGFMRAAASGDAATAILYMLPGGTDYNDMKKILNAKPSSGGEYQFKQMLEAVDLNIPIKITVTEKPDQKNEVEASWIVTFKKSVELGKASSKAGSTFELDATLKKTDSGWLIDGI